jgi:hypothetical protein
MLVVLGTVFVGFGVVGVFLHGAHIYSIDESHGASADAPEAPER